jgi:hypothetical protein
MTVLVVLEVSRMGIFRGYSLFHPVIANAVRYGTAKGEWFLNAVGILFLLFD